MGRPSRSSDQFIVRLPDGLRDRIKTAADANNRSMNAEIVATLEAEYPPPRRADLFTDLELVQLQWHSGEWKSVDDDTWMRFRGGEAPPHVFDRMTEGKNYFVVAVIDREVGLCNLISHPYKLTRGHIEPLAEDYLSEEEREEYTRIFLKASLTEDDESRLQFLREKMEPAFILPPETIPKLRERLERVASTEVVDRLLKRIS